MKRRTKPYTEIGIKRVGCLRCGEPAKYQWQICSDQNTFRPMCLKCDIELNELVLKFVGFTDWKEKLEAYKQSKI